MADQINQEDRCPISATHSRLHQAHLLWHQALRDYQDPDAFCANLNATIQALRSVTWILQKEHDAIPDFKAWYEAWQDRLKQDALLVWLKDSRNRIEKQGDLETHSLARVSLLTGWHDPVPLVEEQVNPLMSGKDIAARLVKVAVPDPIRRHGVLLVERRWVARELPDTELLEALADCYGALAMLVVDAHERAGFVMRTFRRDSHEPKPIRTVHLSGRLPCMVATTQTRTSRLHLGSGELMEPTQIFVPTTPRRREKAGARYGHTAGELSLKPDEDLIEASVRWFEAAKRVLLKDGQHLPFIHLLTPDGDGAVHGIGADDRQALYLLMRQVAESVERIGATGVVHIGEFWMANAEELAPGQLAGDVPTRKETLRVEAATCDGRRRVHMVEFRKDEKGRVELGNSLVMDQPSNWWGFLEPIRQVWEGWERRRGGQAQR